jgi:hypothetical protein
MAIEVTFVSGEEDWFFGDGLDESADEFVTREHSRRDGRRERGIRRRHDQSRLCIRNARCGELADGIEPPRDRSFPFSARLSR